MKHLFRLMKITNMAFRMEWLEKDPFKNYKLRFVKNERDYLTERELGLLENTFFMANNLKRVKDIFLLRPSGEKARLS